MDCALADVSIQTMEKTEALQVDIAILGSGISGATLALIFVRQGLRVAFLDPTPPPRLALGESTITPTAFWMHALAERYNVPELHTIASAASINRHVAPTSGVKKNFGFVLHEENSDVLSDAWQVNIPGSRSSLTGESHLFRQDVDAFLHRAAIKSGAYFIEEAASEIVIGETAVKLETPSGQRIHSKLIIDAAGHSSPLAKHLNLRESPVRYRTQSRAIFAHMRNVIPFDRVKTGNDFAKTWHRGTLHHLFPGGWIWVIPFDNHPRSKNPLCSVGLNLDLNCHPVQPGSDPQAEWAKLIGRYPLIARQFERAENETAWASTGRLQYSSSQTVGDRFILTAQAAGNIDALYSRGLLNTFQSMSTLVRLVVDAFKGSGEFSRDHFLPLERQQQSLLALHDSLVAGAYEALSDPGLVSSWLALWGLSERLTVLHILEPFRRYAESRDPAELDFDQNAPESCIKHHDAFCQLLELAQTSMKDFRAGKLSASSARNEIARHCAAARASFWIDPDVSFPLGGYPQELQKRRARFQRWEGRLIDLKRSLPLSRSGLGQFDLDHYDGSATRTMTQIFRQTDRLANWLRLDRRMPRGVE